MDFTLDTTPSHYQIRSYEPGRVVINEEEFTQNLVVSPTKLICPWDEHDVEIILALDPEVVLLGTGEKFVLVPPKKLMLFYAKNIGVEVMDTAAACRTFNVLASEGRRVVAGLIV